MTETANTTPTADTASITRTLQTEVEGLMRAISRAESDLQEARALLQRGNVPYSTLGRVLSQSALDVDSRGSRLQVLLDVVGAAGLTEDQVLGAIRAGAAK